MGKLIAWILNMTKVGKVVGKTQTFLDGKKVYLAGAAIAVPALVTIITKFADQGTPYLLGVMTMPEWDSLMLGIGMMAGRAAIAKAAVPAQ
jgi:hypothetical protein